MEPVQFHSYTRDEIFDKCCSHFNGMSEVCQEDIETLFDEVLTTLIDDGLVTKSINADEDVLITPTGRPMEDINDYVNMSKTSIETLQFQKSILGCLTLDKSVFNSIILYCQYDKSNQQGLFIIEMIRKALDEKRLPVTFVIGDNLSSLMDQTMDGFHKILCNEFGVETYEGLICLKGDEKVTQKDIENYIDLYEADHQKGRSKKRPPPIIMALNNNVQLKKIINIHQNMIVEAIARNPHSPLCSIFDFDEFDKVYRSLRHKFKPLLLDSPVGIYSVLGVTGSKDDICDDCPEWASSNLVRVEVNAEKEQNYRGIQHPDAVVHRYKQPKSLSNNNYALNIIESNPDSFKNAKVNPINGCIYYPKTIILGDHRINGQKTLATKLLAMGFHVILQNENNLKVCRTNDTQWKTWSIRKKVVRDELFKMFNDLNMWSAPVALIGNKKLDRGLGYQYAPPGEAIKGLIWTNEIMGNIKGNANRVQKVSRLHGVIAHCLDYPNELNFWIDEDTELTVRNENGIIKSLHEGYMGFHTLGERMDYARKVTKLVAKSRNYIISESFSSQALARQWFVGEKEKWFVDEKEKTNYSCNLYGLYLDTAINGSKPVEEGTPGITKIRYRGEFMSIMKEDVLRKTNDDIGQGANYCARIMPVFVNDNIKFVVIYKKKSVD